MAAKKKALVKKPIQAKRYFIAGDIDSTNVEDTLVCDEDTLNEILQNPEDNMVDWEFEEDDLVYEIRVVKKSEIEMVNKAVLREVRAN